MKFTIIKLMRNSLIPLSMILLSACSFLSPVKVDLPDKYILNNVPTVVPTKKTRSTILLVSIPETRPIYNTTQMVYTSRPYQISYFSKNEWAETPAQMLHPLLIQTLQKTYAFKAIVSPPYNGRYDYIINTEILELKQDFNCPRPMLVMSVRAQILKMSINQVIATKQFTVRLPIPSGTPYGGVIAANHGIVSILRRTAGFCVRTIN